MRVGVLLVAMLVLAGCAGSSSGTASSSGADFSGLDGKATDTTGLLRGVVVDVAIRPIAGVAIAAKSGATEKTTTSDAQGRFLLKDLQPGTYLVKATHPLYLAAQTSVDVVAGVDEPPIARLQMDAKFSQKPFSTATKFEGFVECGYEAVIITSQCVNDYSTLVINGGCCNQLRTILDNRGYVGGVDRGWQTLVFELTWTPSAQGTSPRMGIVVSYFNRTASDWFASVDGLDPVLARLETNVTHESQGGTPDKIRPEGQNDLYTFGGIRAAEGQFIGAGFEQRFTIYQHNFYYGSPPDPWSFVKGDKPPF